MIFGLWPLPKAPGGGGPQKIVLLHVPFMYVSHTPTLVEFQKKKKLAPNPHSTPKSHPWGMTQVVE